MKNRSLLKITLYFWALFSVSGFAQQPVINQNKSAELYAQLPDEIKKQGKISNAFDGSYPPFVILKEGKMEGVAVDLAQALSQQLGIRIEHEVVADFAGVLAGIQMGRHALTIGPVMDTPERQNKMDFVDFIHEYGALTVPEGNPGKITSFQDVCGKRAGGLAGGAGVADLKEQSQQCIKQGKAAITVQEYPDIATAILAVRSDRSDVILDSAAVMSFYSRYSPGRFELVADGLANYYQGIALPKNSPLTPVIHAAMQKLFANGTYDAIMKKWHIEGNKIPAPGVNLAAEKDTKQ